jgi:hypothetical protein
LAEVDGGEGSRLMERGGGFRGRVTDAGFGATLVDVLLLLAASRAKLEFRFSNSSSSKHTCNREKTQIERLRSENWACVYALNASFQF